MARHTHTVVRGINAWRHKNTVFMERTIPTARSPCRIPQIRGTSSSFDTVFCEVAAATEIAKDIRVWNPNLGYYRVHFGAIRALLYAIQASRKIDVPAPPDAQQRFNLLDPGLLPVRDAAEHRDPSTTSPDHHPGSTRALRHLLRHIVAHGASEAGGVVGCYAPAYLERTGEYHGLAEQRTVRIAFPSHGAAAP